MESKRYDYKACLKLLICFRSYHSHTSNSHLPVHPAYTVGWSNDKTPNLARASQFFEPQTHRPMALCDLSMVVPSPIAHYVVYRTLFLRIGCQWFNPRLGQYSFRGLMILSFSSIIYVPYSARIDRWPWMIYSTWPSIANITPSIDACAIDRSRRSIDSA